MKTTKLLICAIALVSAIAAAKARGQNLSATLIGINPGLAITGTVDNGSFTQAYPSGVLSFTEFDAFCFEPNQGISFNETLVYQIQNPLSLVTSDLIARVIGGYLGSSQSNEQAAAVQWAIWELTTESLESYSLADGNVRITDTANPNVLALANEYLAQASTFSPANVTFLSNPTRQDVVSWNVIPEPASAGLLALSSLLLLRRRRA